MSITNFKYNNIDISNIVQGFMQNTNFKFATSDLSTLLYGSRSFTSIVNETVPNLGYTYNNVDISTFAIAKYINCVNGQNIVIPNGCTSVGVVMIGGGGGSGGGGHNNYVYNPSTFQYVNNAQTLLYLVQYTQLNCNNHGTQHQIALSVNETVVLNNLQIQGGNQTYYQRGGNFVQAGKGQFITSNSGSNNNNQPANIQSWGQGAAGGGILDNNVLIQLNRSQNDIVYNYTRDDYQAGYYNQLQQNYQAVYSQAYNQNSGGQVGQPGQIGGFIYFTSQVQAGTNVQIQQLSNGGSAGTAGIISPTAGGDTKISIGQTTYTCPGGGNSATASSIVYELTNCTNSLSQYGVGSNQVGSGGITTRNTDTTSNVDYGSGGSSGTSGYARVYFYYNNIYYAIEFGNITTSTSIINGLSPTLTQFPSSSKWIWINSNALTNSSEVNKNIVFTYTFTYSGSTNIGQCNIITGSNGYLIFNGSAPSEIYPNIYSGSITIVNGINYIQIVLYNTTSTNGLIASFFDNTSTLVANTSSSWNYKILNTITSESTQSNKIKGGLWTNMYIFPNNLNGQGYFYSAASPAATQAAALIQTPAYYYTNVPSLPIVKSSVVSSFVVSDFNQPNNIYRVNQSTAWGFKAFGFFLPDVTGNWTFSMSVDDVAELWIGSDSNGNIVPICPSASSNIKVWWVGGTQTYTVRLISGKYYPILLYYGEGNGGENLNFTYSPTGGTLGQVASNYLYYINGKTLY
jgi:hypothetical protein